MKEIIEEYRCACGKLFFRGLILSGDIEVKCRFCKNISKIAGLAGGLSTDTRYVLFTDRTGAVVRMGSTAPKHIGFTAAEIVGTHVTDHVMMLEENFYQTLWDTLEKKGRSALFHTLQRHKDKSFIPITVDAQSFSNEDDRYLVFSIEKRSLEKQFGTGGRVSL